MTEKISAKICKKCKIKPLELTGCSFTNLQRFGIEEGTDVCEAAEREDENFKCADCKYSKVAKKLFPDFGYYVNFYKLYNLKVNESSLCYLLHSHECITSSKDFLETLHRILQEKSEFIERIKETIRNERWTL